MIRNAQLFLTLLEWLKYTFQLSTQGWLGMPDCLLTLFGMAEIYLQAEHPRIVGNARLFLSLFGMV